MSKYYIPQRSRNLYRPGCDKPFRVSRSKIDLFNKCPRCFYIDRRLGTGQPPGYPFAINSAVDSLLKKVDVVLLETNDGRPHLQQAFQVIKACLLYTSDAADE
mgnify:CR=1 FL=1